MENFCPNKNIYNSKHISLFVTRKNEITKLNQNRALNKRKELCKYFSKCYNKWVGVKKARRYTYALRHFCTKGYFCTMVQFCTKTL